MAKDQFNIPDAALEILADEFVADITTNATALGVPTKVVTEGTAVATEFKAKYDKTKDKKNRTSLDTENKNVSRKKMITYLRINAKQYYYDNPAATSAMIMAAGLKAHGNNKVKKSVDSNLEIPNVSVEPAKGHKIELECLNNADTKAKPAGATLIRVKFNLGIPVPSETEDFPAFLDFSKHPIVLSFKVADAGKPLAIAVCYVMANGTEGSCCDVIFTNVP